MIIVCFSSGAAAPLGLRPISAPQICPHPRRPTARSTPRRKLIIFAEDKPKGSPRDRPLPQGFGKSSSSSSGQKLAFVGADKIGISFTCDVQNCGERITKSIKRRSYEKGTVLIQCPKCEKHHIIADNMGLYAQMTGGKKNVEEIAKDAGVAVNRVSADAFQLDNTFREAKNLDKRKSDLDPDAPDDS